MEMSVEHVVEYLLKNKPRRRIENVFAPRDDWYENENQLEELIYLNIEHHNCLVTEEFAEYGFYAGLSTDQMIGYVIDCDYPENTDRMDWYIRNSVENEAGPIIDMMKTSPFLRKTGLEEVQKHLLYQAMDAAMQRNYNLTADRDEYWTVDDLEIMDPFNHSILIYNKLKEEFE